jgi:membrane-associated PAP2 superfamily phosphatase
MTYYKRLITCLISLAVILTLIHYSDLDLKLQSLFFNFETKKWLISPNETFIKFILYRFPKYCIVTYGVILVFWLAKLSLYQQNLELQKKLFFLISVLILTPLTVSLLKHYSPIICPLHLVEFGGNQPHISPLNIFNDGIFFSYNGKCFPAGHASGGFSLLALYFVIPTKRSKFYALAGSLTLGSIMGLFQMAKGVHYLSDTITTLAIAYIICITMQKYILKR